MQREGERGNRAEYRSQSWVENTNMTECSQEIGYLQSYNLCVELGKMPLITFWSEYLEEDDEWISLDAPPPPPAIFCEVANWPMSDA